MFSDPKKNIADFGLESGMQVADLGAGSGFYAIAAARAVGGGGRVYAVDVQKELLQKLKSTAMHERVSNIEIIWGDVEHAGGTKLRDMSVDRVIVSNILFQLSDKETCAKEIHRILKKNGKVLVVDWSDSFSKMGPTPEHIIPKKSAQDLFEKNGFVYEKDLAAGDHHYGLIFIKQ